MFKSFFALIICFLGLAAVVHAAPTLSSTLEKNYLFITPDNTFPYELHQTRNGILTFSTEYANNNSHVSQYLLIDVPSRDAKPILRDVAKACEVVTPIFQLAYYHVETDSLAYFCYANNSLLIIDQSNYSVEQVIPFNISESWPIVRISTVSDEKSIALLFMDNLYTTTPKASMLVIVDLQVRRVTSEIRLNKDFGVGEAVVAYAPSRKGAYIATNRIQAQSIATTVYSLVNIGNDYQIAPITTVSAPLQEAIYTTTLMSVEDLIVVNNGTDLCYFGEGGILYVDLQVDYKIIAFGQKRIFSLAVASQYGSNEIYIGLQYFPVHKYTVYGEIIGRKSLGGYFDFQVAYGNKTSGDLMFTYSGTFNVIDLKDFQTIYTTANRFFSFWLLNSTYAIHGDYFNVYDLKTDALLGKNLFGGSYYTKEQSLLSSFDGEQCNLIHTDLITGKNWTTISLGTNGCLLGPENVRLTDKGVPELTTFKDIPDGERIFTESYGELSFKFPEGDIYSERAFNFDFDTLTFYYLFWKHNQVNTNASFYAYDFKSKQFKLQGFNLIQNLPADHGFYRLNATAYIAVGNNTFSIINGLNRTVSGNFAADWNYATSFEDYDGNQYVLLNKRSNNFWNLFPHNPAPGLFLNGNSVPLPGARDESSQAQAAGPHSYWIIDALGGSVGLARLYSVNEQQTLISI